MRLIPLDAPELIARVASCLSEKGNFQWFDFARGPQQMTPAVVKIMAQRETNVLRVFTANDDETPIGVVGLQNVDRAFKTAPIWRCWATRPTGGGSSRVGRCPKC